MAKKDELDQVIARTVEEFGRVEIWRNDRGTGALLMATPRPKEA